MTSSQWMRDRPVRDVVDDAVDEIILGRIAGQVTKWQDGDRRARARDARFGRRFGCARSPRSCPPARR